MDRAQRGLSWKGKAFVCAWALCCLLFFLVLRFPYDIFKPRLENALTGYLGNPVTLGAIHGAFPLGITATDVRIKNEPMAESLTIKPSFFGLFLGRAGVNFKLKQAKGSLHGNMRTALLHPGKSLGLKLVFKNFDLTPTRGLLKNNAFELFGVVNGKFVLNTKWDAFQESTGNVALSVKQGQLNLMMRNIAAAAFPFDDFILEAEMGKGQLSIKKGELSGKDISGRLGGSMRLGLNMASSNLNISGNLKIPPAYRNMIGLRGERAEISLNGNASRPRLVLREGPRVLFQTRY